MNRIAIVNESTVVSEADVQRMVSAWQIQMSRDLWTTWGLYAYVTYTPPGVAPPASAWVAGIFDDADQANALGYHDLTPAGLPLGKIFAKTSQQAGVQVSAVGSHELLEMVGDPEINVLYQDGVRVNRMWAGELCDAVEDDAAGYFIGRVLVSDFVLPKYFMPTLNQGGPWDFRNVLTGPVPSLSPGGYMAYLEKGTWGQVFGHARARRAAGKPGGSGRFERRQSPPIVSTFPVREVQAP